jgi:4'-phosphopantetheinyl transferase
LISTAVAEPSGMSRRADRNAVYLSWVNLDQPDTAGALEISHLSADERKRADRYHRAVDRDRFIAARGYLRRLLGSFLDVSPEEITFVSGTHGKPGLGGQFVSGDIRFNLAHSEQMAVFAVALSFEVGVDVERVRPNVRYPEIARRMFAPGEYAQLEALGDDEGMRAFYRCWTRKEAYVKATGAGLTLALDSFEVPVTSQAVPFPVVLHDIGLPSGTLTDISPDDDFAATLAVLGPEDSVPLVLHNPG